ncbi:MAG: hypothetical protein MHM6MM_007370 [Cercozoa sp. M6MM]
MKPVPRLHLLKYGDTASRSVHEEDDPATSTPTLLSLVKQLRQERDEAIRQRDEALQQLATRQLKATLNEP